MTSGVIGMAKRSRINRLSKNIIKLFVEDKYPIYKIANRFKVCHKSITKLLNENNFDTKANAHSDRVGTLKADKVTKLFIFNKMTVAQVSRETGVSTKTISKILKKRKIDPSTNIETRSLLKALFYVFEPRKISGKI